MMNRVDLMSNDTGLGNATPGRRLSCVPLLSSLDESSLAAFEAEFEWVSVPGGSTLFREDQVADAVYVVIAGCLGVTVRGSDGQDVLVARTRAGETIGEMGLLGGGLRSATVTALRDTELLRLGKSSFEKLVERHPQSMMSIMPVRLSARGVLNRRCVARSCSRFCLVSI
jgi:NTE family protein